MKKRYYIYLLLVLQQATLWSQQLDQIGKKDALKISGGISANQVYKDPVYANDNPYAVVLGGNLTATLYGFSVPLSFTWSNYKWTYTQPFNQFSLSPSYKWATLHLGYSSMSFSPYSLNGHTFAGAGIELAPGERFKFSAMYGQLGRATAGDTLRGIDPQYERYGSGMKLEYRFDKADVGVNLFYAADNRHKPISTMDSLGIMPRENLIVGTHLGLALLKSLRFTGDVSSGLLSSNRNLSKATDVNSETTQTYWAGKTSLAYSNRLGSIGAAIEYVQPGYNSLGSYYMVNDFLDYTLNVATSLLKGKVTVAGSTGIRQNNLDGNSDEEQKNVVNNLNIGFTPSQKLSFNIGYSNFMNYTYIRTVFDEVDAHTQYELMDTLDFTQINENINLSSMWRIAETENAKHAFTGNLGLQQATQSQSDVPGNAGSRFTNASGGYQLGLPHSGFSAGLNFNYSRTKADSTLSQAYGPLLSARQSLFDKKVQTNLSVSWNTSRTDGKNMGEAYTARGGAGYLLKKAHQFNLSLAYSHRQSPSRQSNAFTATLGYSFRFDYPKRKSGDE